MFERLHNPGEVFNYRLGAALKMEREIVGTLDELIEEAHEQQIKEALRTHQAETREHVRRVEEVFRVCGWEVDDSPCPTVEALAKEGKATIKKAEDPLVDGIILAGAIETEHHEMAVYEDLIIHAQATGHEEAVSLLRQNHEEERRALEKVASLAQSTAGASHVGATA